MTIDVTQDVLVRNKDFALLRFRWCDSFMPRVGEDVDGSKVVKIFWLTDESEYGTHCDIELSSKVFRTHKDAERYVAARENLKGWDSIRYESESERN